MYKKGLKRFFDIVISLVAIVMLLPLEITLLILIRIKIGYPIFFKEERVGKGEKVFMMRKFRTMSNAKDEKGILLPDHLRLKKLGIFLRKSSLDELPELWNIFIGDMSLIGPRPLPICYLPFYNDIEKKRHLIRPGLTGLAQINGRNSISWKDKFEYDVKYVEHVNLITDLKIFFTTFFKVFKKEGVIIAGTEGGEESFYFYRGRQLQEKRQTTFNEVGSNFYITTDGLRKENGITKNNEHIDKAISYQYLSNGRNAIRIAIKNIPQHYSKVVLLPIFNCESVISPFVDAGYKIIFYHINRDLSVNESSLYEVIKTNDHCVVYLMSYFGKYTLNPLKNKLRKKYGTQLFIFEDITQSYFYQGKISHSDLYIASLRKWCPVLDGGVFINTRPSLENIPEIEDNKRIDLILTANQLKVEYVGNLKKELKDRYRGIYEEAEALMDLKTIYCMSSWSKYIYNHLDFNQLIERRRENYALLFNGIADSGAIKHVLGRLRPEDVPFYFPVYVFGDRARLQKYLAQHNIYASIFWDLPSYCKEKLTPEDHYLYEQLLGIPCDQRYSKDDMLRVIDVINHY